MVFSILLVSDALFATLVPQSPASPSKASKKTGVKAQYCSSYCSGRHTLLASVNAEWVLRVQGMHCLLLDEKNNLNKFGPDL